MKCGAQVSKCHSSRGYLEIVVPSLIADDNEHAEEPLLNNINKMICVGFLLFLVAVQRYAAALQCYTCDGADDIDVCKTISDCETGQSCFTRSQTKEQNMTYSMGCTDNQNCGENQVYSSMSASVEQCYECCGHDKCNDKLCQHKQPPPCEDAQDNCAYWNEMFNICKDIHNGAKLICRKFCNLCSLVDGNWADWSPWSSCDVTCGHGQNTRVRTCSNPAQAHQGLDCQGNNSEKTPCIRPLCPVHGGWADWSDWGACPVTCGTGIQKRHRNCSNPYPLRYGDHCFGDDMDVKICMQEHCNTRNGGWSNWDSWVSCSASCDGGMRTRSRSCTNPKPDLNGEQCQGDPMQVETCNSNACTSNMSVTFTVQYVTDMSPDKEQRLIFSRVLANEGGAYNYSSGVFVAPKNGTYVFYSTICMTSCRSMHFDIMVENISFASAYGYACDSCECPSAQAVVQLKANDNVYVQWGKSWANGSRKVICQNDPYQVNQFSGSLIN